jgi:hypothetical protein
VVAHGSHRLDVPAGANLDLERPVALVAPADDGFDQAVDRPGHAHGDAGRHDGAGGAEEGGHRPALGAQAGVEGRALQGRLGHVVAPHLAQRSALQQAGHQVVLQDVQGAGGVLRPVRRLGLGHALAPARRALGGHGPDDDDLPVAAGAAGGGEGLGERHLRDAQLDALEHDLHRHLLAVSARPEPGRGLADPIIPRRPPREVVRSCPGGRAMSGSGAVEPALGPGTPTARPGALGSLDGSWQPAR